MTTRLVQTDGSDRVLSAAGTLVADAAMTAPQKQSIAGGGRLQRKRRTLGAPPRYPLPLHIEHDGCFQDGVPGISSGPVVFQRANLSLATTDPF
jgi:hypothetical protein